MDLKESMDQSRFFEHMDSMDTFPWRIHGNGIFTYT